MALGARTIQNFDSEMAKNATHLIFQTSQTKPASRDFSLATQNKVKIVHPDWIRHTAQKGNRQPEASYKHTRNSKRSLEVLIESQGMSRVSSSSSSKSAQEAPASDDNDLPPPLKIPSAASTPAMAHSTPRSIRSPEPPKLKTTSSSSSAPFASTPDRLQALSAADDQNYSFYPPEQHKLDDSGFVASAGKGKVNIETSMSLQTPSEMHRGPKPIDETLVSKKSLLAEMEALLQKDEPTPQQLSARLPFKQQGLLQSRTSLRKTVGRFGGTASPNSSLRASAASIGTSEGASLSRRQPSKQFEETQFGHDRNDDTQTQSMLEEQTMVIRINDPVAEATKAKTLAEMRRARTGEDSPEDAADAEATQRSTDETKRSSSRRSRSGHYATRQRS